PEHRTDQAEGRMARHRKQFILALEPEQRSRIHHHSVDQLQRRFMGNSLLSHSLLPGSGPCHANRTGLENRWPDGGCALGYPARRDLGYFHSPERWSGGFGRLPGLDQSLYAGESHRDGMPQYIRPVYQEGERGGLWGGQLPPQEDLPGGRRMGDPSV